MKINYNECFYSEIILLLSEGVHKNYFTDLKILKLISIFYKNYINILH